MVSYSLRISFLGHRTQMEDRQPTYPWRLVLLISFMLFILVQILSSMRRKYQMKFFFLMGGGILCGENERTQKGRLGKKMVSQKLKRARFYVKPAGSNDGASRLS